MTEAGFKTDFTSLFWTYASGFPKAMNIGKMVDKRQGAWSENHFANPVEYETGDPITEDAKKLEGSYGGFQPKPAVEVIIVAMKPLSEKTYVDQALKNGKGITWLDDCRIPTEENLNGGAYSGGERSDGEWKEQSGFKNDNLETFNQPRGRFPANLLVSDDVLDDGSWTRDAGIGGRGKYGRGEGYGFKPTGQEAEQPTTGGGYSRFFSLDSWAKTLPFLIVPKASKSEKNRVLEEFEEKQTTYGSGGGAMPNSNDNDKKTITKNSHPTVKPLKLMSYLITLGSREGDTVLDPFAGSCTTLVAAKELKRNYIGIEKESEYINICTARLEAVPNTLF